MLKVATNAIAIPTIPMMLPILADFGEDKPFKAMIKHIAETKYEYSMICAIILFLSPL